LGGRACQVNDGTVPKVDAIEITNGRSGATVAWINEKGVTDDAHALR
jgi:hypothetical protein